MEPPFSTPVAFLLPRVSMRRLQLTLMPVRRRNKRLTVSGVFPLHRFLVVWFPVLRASLDFSKMVIFFLRFISFSFISAPYYVSQAQMTYPDTPSQGCQKLLAENQANVFFPSSSSYNTEDTSKLFLSPSGLVVSLAPDL